MQHPQTCLTFFRLVLSNLSLIYLEHLAKTLTMNNHKHKKLKIWSFKGAYALKSSQAISYMKVELLTNILKTCSVFIIRVDKLFPQCTWWWMAGAWTTLDRNSALFKLNKTVESYSAIESLSSKWTQTFNKFLWLSFQVSLKTWCRQIVLWRQPFHNALHNVTTTMNM